MNGGLIKSCELVARVRSGRVVKAGSYGIVMYNAEWLQKRRDTELRGCGKWLDIGGVYKCSECRLVVGWEPYFCPPCGAKMSKCEAAMKDQTYKPETTSHSEREIYDGCIALMQELVEAFGEYLEYIGYDPYEDGNEYFSVAFPPTQIVERLFLWNTTHSGGTSQRLKCRELGIDEDKLVKLYFKQESMEEDR